MQAATFNGSSRANSQSGGDSSNAFSGGVNNGLTVSCWFKMAIPSSASLTKDMVILSNRQSSTAGGNFAFEIAFSITTGNVEFRARGTTTSLAPQVLIAQPFLERWYHVAVTRENDSFIGFLDGRQVFSATQAIGAATNSNGITIGGTSDSANLYGEVIEAAVYRRKLEQSELTGLIFAEHQITDTDLRGYYKLRNSAVEADKRRNFVTPPPSGTSPLADTGTVIFEDTNQAGEQSTFDSHRNGGRDSTAPLSGAYSWEHTVFRRPTVGIPFEFKVGYNSGNSGGTGIVSGFSPGSSNGLGGGWTHTFDARLIPSIIFDPYGSPFPLVSESVGLMLWDGSLEVWDTTDDVNFTTRHGEYRGEVKKVGTGTNATFDWVTPDRLRYIFYTPFAGPAQLKGRLKEIRDFSGNVIAVNWDSSSGKLLTVADTAGGVCQFNYTGSLLSTVTYLGWTATFTPTAAAANRIAALAMTCPPAYASAPPIPATWGFFYKTSVPPTDATFGLLEKIADPRGYNAVPQTYYDLQLTYDKYGRVKQETDALGRTTVTDYGVDQTGAPAPRKVTHIDAATKKWVETFDRKHRVTTRRDALGNTTAFKINDATGTIEWTDDANLNRTEFTYDARANVLTRKDALLRTMTWEYNAVLTGGVPLNKPTKEVRPKAGAETADWETNYAYDTAGNLLRQSDAIGDLVANTYWGDVPGKRGMLKTSTDARGNTTSFDYTAEGFLAAKTVPDVGNTTRTWNYGYTELGWLSTESDPISRTTYLFQNINGQVVSITDPFGRVFNKTFDANGNLTHDYDALGQLTLHEYDKADQKTQTTTRDGKVWAFFYTARGELESTRDPSLTNPSARTLRYEYDDAGRRTKETDANGFFASFQYDLNGNLRFTTDKELKLWEKTYDKLNRVIADKDPLGDTTITAFDAAGRVDTVTSPRGFISRHEYDGRSRLTKWIDAENNPWIYIYDCNGNITRITDALGGHYDMQYGPRNERLREENQDHYVWLYTYDELLRLRTQTDPLPLAADPPQAPPVLRTLTYDLASRVEEVVFSTGRRTVFHYDLNNNPDEIRRVVPGQQSATLTLSYDAMDRVTQSLDAYGKTVGYTFDPAGRVKTITYPGAKTLTHGYDSAGRLTTLTDWATPARVSTFGYDKAGRLTTHLYPNGVLDTIGYHDDGTVKKLDFTRAGGGAFTPFALEYAYDRNGNKTQEKKKGVLDWQPGPAAGQVAPFDESYTPRASGRLISSTDALNPARNFTYTYNAAGDMTLAASPGQTTAFTYDEDHRVLTVARTQAAATTGIENRCDALGRRISRKLTPPGSATVETRYVLDLTGSMERILCDTTAAGAITTRYIHGPDGLGYREDAATGAITCYHADAMGNIIRLTDAAGTTNAQYAYNPYGRLLATTGTTANPYRFVGAQGVMEELPNLYFMRARYYSAEAGVFLSTDPVKSIGPGWKAQAYGYANGNPTGYSDPAGTTPVHAGAFWLGVSHEFTAEANKRLLLSPSLQFSLEQSGFSQNDAATLSEQTFDRIDQVEMAGDAAHAAWWLSAGSSLNGVGFSYLAGKYSAKGSMIASDAILAGYDRSLSWTGNKIGSALYSIAPQAFTPNSSSSNGYSNTSSVKGGGGSSMASSTGSSVKATTSGGGAVAQKGGSSISSGAVKAAGVASSFNLVQSTKTANSTQSVINKSATSGGGGGNAVTNAISKGVAAVNNAATKAASVVSSAWNAVTSFFRGGKK